MKIGIITLTFGDNYGGIVQGWALQTLLARLGHKAEMVQLVQRRRRPLWKVPLSLCKRILKKLLIDKHTLIFEKREIQTVRQHTNRFIYTRICPRDVKSAAQIQKGDYDAFVVGSDQVWRYCYNCLMMQSHLMPYLGFAQGWDVGRYAYAASFGVDEWDYPPKYDEVCRKLAGQFNAISVREDTAVTLCKKQLGVEAVHLLDPTMLLGEADYRKLVDEAGVAASAGDLFYYILDPTPQKQDIINRTAEHYGLKPFTVVQKHKINEREYPLSERIVPPVESWLRAFMDAKMVVTDSFHGCAFSINFGRPFVAIGNEARGLARMESILRMFAIEDHLLIDPDGATAIPSPYLPEDTPRRLEQYRKQALQFLKQIK